MKKIQIFLNLMLLMPVFTLSVVYAQPPENLSNEKIRIILETSQRQSLGILKKDLSGFLLSRYDLTPDEYYVERLFEGSEELRLDPHYDLSKFFLFSTANRTYGDFKINPFDFGYELIEELNLESAEPDLPYTNYLDMQPQSSDCFDPEFKPKDLAWSLKAMGVDKAWQLQPPSGGYKFGEGIIIGHPDTGYNQHDDLDQKRIKPGLGYDFVDKKQDPKDPLDYNLPWQQPGHGIATGSVIISEGTVDPNPETGTGPPGKITGVAPKATLVPIRAIKTVIRIFNSSVAKAVYHATDNVYECRIISMSLGGLPNKALRASIEHAVIKNLIVVAAAGNCVETVVYPARYNSCIAVAGTNFNDKPWKGSAHGSSVDISAPGEYVWRAQRAEISDPVDIVDGGSGTSFSTANVAGISALWLGFYGFDNLREKLSGHTKLQFLFRILIKDTARIPSNWNNEEYGSGIIDALMLLKTVPYESDLVMKAIESYNIFLMERRYEYVGLISELLETPDFIIPEIDHYGAELMYNLINRPEILKYTKRDFKRTSDNRKRLKKMSERLQPFSSKAFQQEFGF